MHYYRAAAPFVEKRVCAVLTVAETATPPKNARTLTKPAPLGKTNLLCQTNTLSDKLLTHSLGAKHIDKKLRAIRAICANIAFTKMDGNNQNDWQHCHQPLIQTLFKSGTGAEEKI